MTSPTPFPFISINFQTDTLKISKSTIDALGNPKRVLVFLDKERHSLAVIRSDKPDWRSWRVRFGKGGTFNLRQKSFVSECSKSCTPLQKTDTYNFSGSIHDNPKYIKYANFHLTEWPYGETPRVWHNSF